MTERIRFFEEAAEGESALLTRALSSSKHCWIPPRLKSYSEPANGEFNWQTRHPDPRGHHRHFPSWFSFLVIGLLIFGK
jgi:hypothetical protein